MEQVKEFAERRKYERLEKEFSFRYSLANDLVKPQLNEEGLVLDIGGGGVRFLSSQRWMKNEQLMMQLNFRGWKIDGDSCDFSNNSNDYGRMLVVGSVMWSAETALEDQFEVGVRFTARMQTDEDD